MLMKTAILVLFTAVFASPFTATASRYVEVVEALPASAEDTTLYSSEIISVASGERITPVASIPVISPLGGGSPWFMAMELRFSPGGSWYTVGTADVGLGGGTPLPMGESFEGPLEVRVRFTNSVETLEDIANRIVFLLEGDSAEEVIPASSVVIPTDASGPVQIILESSADMVTWTQAVPGTYDPSTTNRFFRVRAVVQND